MPLQQQRRFDGMQMSAWNAQASHITNGRPFKYNFLCLIVYPYRPAGAALMAEEWLDKARRYTTVTEVQIKPNPKGSAVVAVQKAGEAEKVR